MTTVSLNYKPRIWFTPFHERSTRFAVIVAHRRCGKTEACLAELAIRALNTRKRYARYAYLAPFKSQGVTVAWDRLQRILGNELIKLCKLSQSEKSILLPNGSKIFIIGADNFDAIRGNYFDGVILDEVGDMHPDAWPQVILPALADREGWAVFIGTPKGKNFFYEQYLKATRNDDGNWFSLTLPVSLTHLIPEYELEVQRGELDEDEYMQEYECSFDAALKGSYWSKQLVAAEAEGRIGPLVHVKNAPVDLAFDLGWDDSTAVWFFQVVNGQWDVLHYYETNGQSIAEIVSDLKQIAKTHQYKFGTWWVPHDAKAHSVQTGKTMIQQMVRLGAKPRLVPRTGDDSKGLQQGIQAVRASIPKLRLDNRREHCFDGLEALKAYKKKWSDKLQTFSNQPEHDWSSHAADAFRYMCLAVRDKDIADSKKVEEHVETPQEAFSAWHSRSRINSVQVTAPTLDELWKRQERKSRYVRI